MSHRKQAGRTRRADDIKCLVNVASSPSCVGSFWVHIIMLFSNSQLSVGERGKNCQICNLETKFSKKKKKKLYNVLQIFRAKPRNSNLFHSIWDRFGPRFYSMFVNAHVNSVAHRGLMTWLGRHCCWLRFDSLQIQLNLSQVEKCLVSSSGENKKYISRQQTSLVQPAP